MFRKKIVIFTAILIVSSQFSYADRTFDEIMSAISSGATEIKIKDLTSKYINKHMEATVYVADVIEKNGQYTIYAAYEKQPLYSQYNSDVRIKVNEVNLRFIKTLSKGTKIIFKGKLEKVSEGFITISSDGLSLGMGK